MVFMIKTDSDQHAVKWEIRKTEWEAKEAKGRIHADQCWVSSVESSREWGQKKAEKCSITCNIVPDFNPSAGVF